MAKKTDTKAAKAKAIKAKAAKAKATIKAKQDKAKEALVPIAKEINHRLKQAAKMEADALDHRLAAAIQADKAKKQCKASRVNFKSWCDAHLTMNYENIRKLARIGAAPNPKLALDDMRAKAVIAQAKQREKAKAEKEAAKKSSRGSLGKVTSSKPKQVDTSVPLDTLKALEPSIRKDTIASAAAIDGMKLVTSEQAELLDNDPIAAIVKRYKAMSQTSQRKLVARLAEVGLFKVKYEKAAKPLPKSGEDDLADIPAFLKRDKPTKTKPKAKAKPKAKKSKASKRSK
jgi:hypothetical protein|tara:strand:- start:351 stop:1211 length:861 start_codon:yes stop_codon:yes gene_type:complete